MRKRLIVVAGVLACAALALLLVRAASSPRLTYSGRPVKVWALQLYATGQQREDAVVAFKAMGEKAVPDLVRLLSKLDLPFRNQVLAAVPSMPAAVRPLLLALYRMPAYEVKIASARALAIIGPEASAASPALALRMRDKNRAVANEAALALAQVSPESVRQFQVALRDHRSNACRAAAYALGGLGASARPAVPDLLRALTDPDQQVRQSADWSLERIGAAVIAPMLENIVQERSPVRERLSALLVNMYSCSPSEVPQIAKLRFDAPELQDERVKALRKIGPGQVDPTLLRTLAAMLNDPSPPARVAAIEALGGISSPVVVVALIRRLQDEDAAVRAGAARGLGALGDAARPALFKLRGLATSDEGSVRVAAAEALAKMEGTPPQR